MPDKQNTKVEKEQGKLAARIFKIMKQLETPPTPKTKRIGFEVD